MSSVTYVREQDASLSARLSVHAPHLIDVEIAHVLRRYVLRGILNATRGASATRGAPALDHWRALDVERYSHELFLDRVWQLRDHVSAYDAVYVALAEALAALLVTGDGRLLRAPGLRDRIELA